jgi:hypothetical protein
MKTFATFITDARKIEYLRIATIASGLKLEIKTGMRHSSNATFEAAKKLTGAKTRLKAYEAVMTIKERMKADLEAREVPLSNI